MRFARVFLLRFFSLTLIIAACSSHEISGRFPRWVVDDMGCLTLEKEAGICVEVDKCRTISDLVEGHGNHPENDDHKAILKSHACGVDDWGGLKVCCDYDAVG
ncbi:hypothetical protein Trydic_g19963 [Trypoxylus dichotomus]